MASRFSRPPKLVRLPLPLLAGVVEVDHRGDGIHAQAVDVEFVQPVQRVGDEEVADFAAAEVEDQRSPVRVFAQGGVGMLVQGLAVEPRQRPLILGESVRDPVQQHADAGLVEFVHEVPEFVGVTEARRRGEVGRDLVAPGPAEGVFGHRHELHMGEAEPLDVSHQLLGQFAVAEADPPGARSVLRRRSWASCADPCPARALHPFRVLEGVAGLHNAGGSQRRNLGAEGQGISLLDPVPGLVRISYL
jgi:hypothetical protein